MALARAQNASLDDAKIGPPNTNVVVTVDEDSGNEGDKDDQSLDDRGDNDQVTIQSGEAR